MLPPALTLAVSCAGASAQPARLSASQTGAAAACRPVALRAVFRGFQPSGGPLAGAVVVVDAGPRSCLLAGNPRSVGLLDDGGALVALKERPLNQPAGADAVALTSGVPLPPFGAPPPQGSAWFGVTWSNWCSEATPSVRTLLVGLPAGGTVMAPLDQAVPSWAAGPPTPRCVDPRADSVIAYGRFQPAQP